jgi:molybdopterin molybdotransferase
MEHDMISVDEARQRVIELAGGERFRTPVESVGLFAAINRVAAADLTSDIDVTPFDNTAMDGFAVVKSSLDAATEAVPVELEIVDWVGAGVVSEITLRPDQAIRIMTGGIMPEGADAVVKIEDVTFTGDGGVGERVRISAPATKTNVRKAGEEAKAGDVVVKAGEVIRAATAGLLASTGNVEIPVYARPKVGIISIGTELVTPPEMPAPGKIRDANSYVLASYALDLDCEIEIYPIVEDSADAIRRLFEQAISECDFVVSSGGASDGDFDYAIETVRELGEIVFDSVSIRPGKAQAFGYVGDTLVEVLSGNPAAAAVGFQLFGRAALRAMQGFKNLDRPVSNAVLAQATKKKEDRAFYQRGHLEVGEDGQLLACQEEKQSSALLSEMNRCTVLIELPQGKGMFDAGTPVKCLHLDIEEGAII